MAMKHDHLHPDLDILEAEIEDGPPRSTLEIRREAMAWFVAAARERDGLAAEVARLTAERDELGARLDMHMIDLCAQESPDV